MSERKPSPFKTLLESDVCTLIKAVTPIKYANPEPRGERLSGAWQLRTIMVDVGLSSNYPHLPGVCNHIDESD